MPIPACVLEHRMPACVEWFKGRGYAVVSDTTDDLYEGDTGPTLLTWLPSKCRPASLPAGPAVGYAAP